MATAARSQAIYRPSLEVVQENLSSKTKKIILPVGFADTLTATVGWHVNPGTHAKIT